jgi:hypothetical protein
VYYVWTEIPTGAVTNSSVFPFNGRLISGSKYLLRRNITPPYSGAETKLRLLPEHKFRVLENGALRIFEPKEDEVLEKLHNEELCNLYSSPSMIRIIKLRRKRWAGHVARRKAKRRAYRL